MCLYPKLIPNPKYKPNKRNGGIIPPIRDSRVLLVPVGCGKCIECLKQKSLQWKVRLNEEIKHTKYANYVTLTFSEQSLKELTFIAKQQLINETEENEIATIAVRRFLERWRKKYKKSIKHWLITELGHTNTERIHLHGIIFTEHQQDIEKIWQYGFIKLGNGIQHYVNERTINYIIKYVTKQDADHKGYTPKILCSKGIGAQYMNGINKNQNKFNNEKTNETYKTQKGTKLNLPIYYRNKLYTEEQREQLWLNKLDKEERWICGEKISIKTSEKGYYQLLDYYRKKK